MTTELIVTLFLILIIIGIILGFYFFIKIKLRDFTSSFFGTTDLKKTIEKSEILASETPKSISSMENLYLSKIKKDYSDLNINELKSMTESAILDCLNSIETKKFKPKNLIIR